MRRNEGTYDEALLLIMERYGYREETYYTFSYSPVPNEQGGGGIFCANTAETGRIFGERQLALLRELAAKTTEVRTIEDVCRVSAACLGGNLRDLPFSLVYLVDPDGRTASLAGAAGIEPGHPGAPAVVALDRGDGWPLAAPGRQGEATLVGDLAARFGPLPSGAWDEPPTQAIVAPIAASGETGRAGFLVAGLNPFRAVDAEYRGFFDLVTRQIAGAIGNAQAYEEERKRAEALAEIDRAKTTFFSNVSHEFRTPLTLMLGPLEDEIAAAREGDAASRERLDMTHRNALRLLKLVNTLLDFSRIEAGRVQASYEPTELGGFTAELASNFRSACEKAGIGLTVDCPPLAEPAFVDRDMWEKIVLNLLSNAFKFTLEGGVAVRLRREGPAVVLTVSDTGSGVPAHELPRLFDRFHRVEGARGRTHEGTGIGLALVQELVRQHGGRVEVESEVDVGSAFRVAIPAGSAHLPADRIRAARTQASTALGAQPFVEEALRWLPGGGAESGVERPLLPEAADVASEATERRPTVLLADDNADMRDYVRRLLSGRYHVRTVADDAEALAVLREGPRPDLLLSDVMMPELDGFGLVREVRGDPALADLPVIFLSARAGEEASVEGLGAGADDYLVKPFAARELLARVRAALERSQLRAEMRESEARFRNMADNSPVMIWVTDQNGRCVYLNARWREFTGQSAEAGLGLGWLDCVHPEDRPAAEERFVAANARREAFRVECRLRGADGRWRWSIDAASPRFAANGAYLGHVGSVIDIDDRKQAEERQKLLTEELDHRVKNVLATVQSMALRTLGRGDPANALTGRIAALAQTHAAPSQGAWQGVELSQLLANLLEAYRAGAGDRLAMSGPPVNLEPRAAQSLALAVNELATNAAKYGALSTPGGRVKLRWLVEGGERPTLRLLWRESGGPPVAAPQRKGFGTSLIERSLAYELDAEVTLAFEPEGLRCEMRVPMALAASPRVRPPPREAAASADARPASGLAGRRVLVVEDTHLIAEEVVRILEAEGAVVIGPAATLRSALELAQRDDVEAAVLDVNLAGVMVYPVIELLRGRGVPLVLLTGYAGPGALPERFRGLPVLGKPARAQDVVAALARAEAER